MIIPRKDTSVIVAAAGMGQRLGLGPKALLQLDSHSLIWWVTRKALRICDDVIVAAPEQFVNQIQREALECRVIAGGDDRQQSIAALVAACSRKWVVLLDVARPFASSSLCVDVLAAAGTSGIATAVEALQVPAVRVSDG